ncbi:amidase [Nocardia xishanensis]
MPIPAPDSASLAALAEGYGFGMSDADIEEYRPFVAGLLDAWNAVEEMYEADAPVVPDREWKRPAAQENPLNAWYVQTDITETTSGPLAGRTVAIKDNTAVAGVPMANGSDLLDGYVPTTDAEVVRRLLAAGATIAGKAVCENLCFSGVSTTANTGPVLNPWDTGRSAGGSSGGSGALVGAGVVDMAIGGDQGGSIRIPASACGIVGHKPTWGLVPYTGGFPIEQTIDHLGPMTRTVTDAALMLSVIAGPDGVDPRQPSDLAPQDYLGALELGAAGLRVGVLREGFDWPESERPVDDTVRAALHVLDKAGLTVSEVSIPWHRSARRVWEVLACEGTTSQMIDTYGYGLNWKGLYDPEAMAYYGERWHADGTKFPPTVRTVLFAGKYGLTTAYGRYYAMARNLAPKLAAAYDAALAEYDVLIMPTQPTLPKPIADSTAGTKALLTNALEMVGNTAPFDVTGHPACSVPAGLVDGVPVGMMIVGRQFDDATVLRVAHAFEESIGGFPTPNRS